VASACAITFSEAFEPIPRFLGIFALRTLCHTKFHPPNNHPAKLIKCRRGQTLLQRVIAAGSFVKVSVRAVTL